jgi:dynactin complex subunit
MENPLKRLYTILTREIEHFSSLMALEVEKTDAIIEHNGTRLEAISTRQAEILDFITDEEAGRESVSEYITGKKGMAEGEGHSLAFVLQSQNGPLTGEIEKNGRELKELLTRLNNLKSVNEKLIRDNLKYYTILFNGLKDGANPGVSYSSSGRENSSPTHPVLLNQKV